MDAETKIFKPITKELNTLHEGIHYDEYAEMDAINSHGLMDILRSPEHFYERRYHPQEKYSKARDLGKMLHFAVLEPDLFSKKCVVEPEFTGKTKDGRDSNRSGEAQQKKKDWYANLAPDVMVVELPMLEKLLGMSNKILAHKGARDLIDNAIKEATIYWDCDRTGVRCKARLDILSRRGYVVDLKSTRDARKETFWRQIMGYQWDVQHAHYLDAGRVSRLYRNDAYVYIAVESEPPYGVGVYPAGPLMFQRGEYLREKAMKTYAECLKSGKWPGYNEALATIDYPNWVADQLGKEIDNEPMDLSWMEGVS